MTEHASHTQILLREHEQISSPLSLFLESDTFTLFYEAAIPDWHMYSSKPNIMRMFAGAVFETFAEHYLREHLKSGLTFEGGSETLGIFQIMYPYKEIVAHPFGLHSIKGISVPDGIVYNNNRLCLVEYTLLAHSDKLESYCKEKYQNIIEYSKFLHEDIQLLFVTPDFSYKEHALRLPRLKDLIHAELPVSHADIGYFVDYIFDYYRQGHDPHAATLKELTEYM